MIFGGLSGFTNDRIDKEMALYKTYSVNKKVLDILPFNVQYYVKDNFKTVELYQDTPIEITDVEIKNEALYDKQFTILPIDDEYFMLDISEKGILNFFSKPYLSHRYRYGADIHTDDFNMTVSKNGTFIEPIIVKFNGSKRDIYENIIKPNLQVKRLDKKSSLIKISYRDNIPKRGESYINTLAEIFSLRNIAEKSERNEKILHSIDAQLGNVKQDLTGTEDEIEAYKVSENIVQTDAQSASLISQLSKIDFELTQAKMKYSMVSSIAKSIQDDKAIDSISLALSELGDQKISMLFDSLQMAKLKDAELSMEFKDTYPPLKKVKIKIANIKKMIKQNVRSLQKSLLRKVGELKKAKLKAEDVLKTFPEKERKLVNYNRNYSVNSEMYAYLLQLKAEKTIAQSSVVSDFRVLDESYTDKGTAKPKSMLILAVAGITGFILGIFLALMRSFFDENIKDLQTIENYTTLPVYGFVPLVRYKMTSMRFWRIDTLLIRKVFAKSEIIYAHSIIQIAQRRF